MSLPTTFWLSVVKQNCVSQKEPAYAFVRTEIRWEEPEESAYLTGGSFPVGQAKVIFLQQVDMVIHLSEELLAFSMFLHRTEGACSVLITNHKHYRIEYRIE